MEDLHSISEHCDYVGICQHYIDLCDEDGVCIFLVDLQILVDTHLEIYMNDSYIHGNGERNQDEEDAHDQES
jgi:hypothetical protein